MDKKRKVTVDDIAENLLEAAHRIYEIQIGIAMGVPAPVEYTRGNPQVRDQILKVVEPLIRTYRSTKELEANSSSAVVEMLGKGTINPQEAIALLKVIQTRVQVEGEELALQLKRDLIEEV